MWAGSSSKTGERVAAARFIKEKRCARGALPAPQEWGGARRKGCPQGLCSLRHTAAAHGAGVLQGLEEPHCMPHKVCVGEGLCTCWDFRACLRLLRTKVGRCFFCNLEKGDPTGDQMGGRGAKTGKSAMYVERRPRGRKGRCGRAKECALW